MNAEQLYAALNAKLASLNDAQVIDCLKMAKQTKADPYVIAALAAESVLRGLETD